MEKNKKDQELNSEDAQVKQPETDESVPPQAANESREQSDKTAKVKTKEKQTEKQENKAPANRKKQANFIAPYAKAYPGEKIFLVTSDRQVFLLKDKGLAENHQRSLKNGEKIQTIKVK